MIPFPEWTYRAAEIVTWFVIATGLIQILLYIVQLIAAAIALHRRPAMPSTMVLWDRYADLAPPIAVIAPAYNEELSIIESVEALLALHYPEFEVLVVNDGSKDGTLARLIGHYELAPVRRYYDLAVENRPIRGLYANPAHPRLLVIDKENGGKADAMNAGINVARAPLVCVIDADTLLEADALIRVVRPFVEDPVRTVAVGGTIRIANGCRIENGRVIEPRLPRNILALFQVVEYLRAFLMARLGLSQMQTLMIISGAFGLFRRSSAVEVGGFSQNTVGEDMELVVKLHRHMRDRKRDYRITYIPEPVSWTEAPESFSILANQRARWQRGSLETYRKHRDMFLNPRYGRIGFVGFGQVWIVDVIGPIIEIAGYALVPPLWLLGLISFDYLLAFIAVVFTFGVFISVATLVLEEVQLRRLKNARDLATLTIAAIFENFGYRQLNNIWRLRGWWQFLRKKQGWGTMVRKGFQRP
ncbi:glycosyltransferase family 2 protein [Sphingomonas koreensis]|uniref:Glycosyl transferase n=1 Tax=Sphingomonas koreensis TaxID=93064 RepID=A0A1L6JB79_9SPHN|nr:glycosyltransferase family 2 protein [Sphingomonas koreensis]APR53185.1 glycosyl transferase [Sphingomonas koreensis]RSU24690.1 glycosyltransferase family 2 protein [Sphingomonas koreensis]RSU27041.1 glycosyltransferase family 2 protein [Sphingomonas koreensis]RSU29990.1 glycosyltransferase family 2 protein [Sphingomonas koreensis]RSU32876.1 glycosyltransferase family 2 protein [Sphingomonas koreensis]